MDAKAKSVGLLLLTLILGMLLGGLIRARVAEQRIERLVALRSERGFARFIERAIEYDDREQQEAVRQILDDAAYRVLDHVRESRQTMRGIMDETMDSLATVLGDDQMEDLRQHVRDRRPPHERRRRGRRDHPPPPPGP